MSQRVLVTGSTGFVGSWVLRHWRREHPEAQVWATSHAPEPAEKEWHHYRRVDLRDPEAVGELVASSRPTVVIHLAGVIGSAPLELCLSVNVLGTGNLLQAAADLDPVPRIVQISSAATYGAVDPGELPIAEHQPTRPITDYAVSKLAQDQLAHSWYLRTGLEVVVARAFNLVGPGQPDSLVPMAFVRQLLEVRAGHADRIRVGNLTSRRDFVDVRDVAAALDQLAHCGEAGGIFNVGSGSDASIQDVLDELLRLHGSRVPVEVSSGKQRNVDVPSVRADISRITAAVGWQPTISLDDSLRSMWEEAIG